jgi:hypothetical protein
MYWPQTCWCFQAVNRFVHCSGRCTNAALIIHFIDLSVFDEIA